jgi:hypothetical protein
MVVDVTPFEGVGMVRQNVSEVNVDMVRASLGKVMVQLRANERQEQQKHQRDGRHLGGHPLESVSHRVRANHRW